MPWLQIRLDSDPQHSELLENALLTSGAIAVTMEDQANQPLFEPPPGETPLWQHTRITGLFDAAHNTDDILQSLTTQLPTALPPHRFELLEDKDWEREWMAHYHPMQFGKRLWICPSWTPPPDPAAINIMLDPGLAFGTGTHPTTALCLRWLDGQSLEGMTVIDYGCGSGILGIAALLLGAKQVIAVDNDPQALTASRDNAERNQIAPEKLSVFLPDQLPKESSADLVIANILAGPLISLSETLTKLLRPGGKLCLSGILDSQAGQVINAYQQFNFDPVAHDEEWTRLSASKY